LLLLSMLPASVNVIDSGALQLPFDAEGVADGDDRSASVADGSSGLVTLREGGVAESDEVSDKDNVDVMLTVVVCLEADRRRVSDIDALVALEGVAAVRDDDHR
jgi:hypothetical protein